MIPFYLYGIGGFLLGWGAAGVLAITIAPGPMPLVVAIPCVIIGAGGFIAGVTGIAKRISP